MATRSENRAPTEDRPWSRRWGVGLVVAGLVSSILSKHSENLGFPISPDRPLIAAGIGLLFLTGHFSGIGRFRWRSVHTLMVATVLWTVWSAVSRQTLLTDYGFYALLDRLVVPFALFALAPVIFRTEGDRRLLIKALMLLGLYLGLTAIFEMIGPTGLVFPSYIADTDIRESSGRARGPLLSAEANGMILAAALFAAVIAFRRLERRWWLVAAPTGLVAAMGVLLSLTRSVWLGTIVGLIAVTLVSPVLRRRLPVLVAGGAALVVVVLTVVPSLSQMVVDRLTTQRSVFDRANTNAAALRMIAEDPIDGVGWMRFVSLSTEWVRQADTYPLTNVEIEVHNVVLARAAELGLVGAALWIGCIVAGPVAAILRRPRSSEMADWRLALVGFGCLWAVTIMVSPVPYQLPNNLLFLLAGIVLKDHLVPPAEPVAPRTATPQDARATP